MIDEFITSSEVSNQRSNDVEVIRFTAITALKPFRLHQVAKDMDIHVRRICCGWSDPCFVYCSVHVQTVLLLSVQEGLNSLGLQEISKGYPSDCFYLPGAGQCWAYHARGLEDSRNLNLNVLRSMQRGRDLRLY